MSERRGKEGIFSLDGTSTEQILKLVLIGCFLGVMGSAGFCLFLNSSSPLSADPLGREGLFLLFVSLFHLSEFILCARFNPHLLDLSSFLLHTLEYQAAFFVCQIEFFCATFGVSSFVWPK
eukprot:TRINITY_DN7528_c0_g1_i1.p1 TRINITY_DN7528_c0_g1~~TRINITY_DN7528_c0_g1_i1.p1  ORF type:complete len:121 (+),score=16.85 TRINITY_DN7528_c0_g1_i1:85-447(+)